MILFNINYLLAHSEVVSNIAHTNSFSCTQLNGFKYHCYSKNPILHTVKWFQVFPLNYSSSTKDEYFFLVLIIWLHMFK